MKYSWVMVVMLTVLLSFTSGASAEETERSPKGFVKSISDSEIVLTQYDSEKNAEVDVTYLLTPETQAEIYGDIPVGQIQVGDEVEIDFQNNNKKKVAEYVSIDLSSYE